MADATQETDGVVEALPKGIDRGRIGPLDSRKGITVVISAVIIVAALSYVVITRQPDETVKIVAILASSGVYSHTDEIEASLAMAVSDLNRWGGIDGAEIELHIEKTASDAESITQTFLAAESGLHPLIYVTAGCEFMTVLGPLAEENEAPLIGIGSEPGLTDGMEWVYRYTISAQAEAASAVSLADRLNIGSVGILYSSGLHSCGIEEALLEEFMADSMTVEAEEFETKDEIPEKISTLQDNQAILCVGSCSELAVMLPAIEQSAFGGYILTISCGSTPLLWNTLEDRDVYVSAPLIYKPENINAQDFALRFESTYNLSATHHGAVMFDTVHLVSGLVTGMEPTRENLEAELSKDFIFSGVLGVLRIDAGVHDFEIEVFPAIISEGELRYL